jgi:hypothetical protein
MSDGDPDGVAVDIVVNNYNYGRFLAAAVGSALAQTHPRTSVIVVDDGSSDDSREVLAGFEDRVALVLKENGGQSSALNAGLELCEGDVVLFLDSDDVLHPGAAAAVAAAFAAAPTVSKVQFRMEVIDAAGEATGEIKPPLHLPLPEGDLRRAELAYPFDMAWLPTSANAFRLESLRTILPIPVDDYPVCGADWYLLHLTTLLGEVRSLDAVYASYRVHGGNNYESVEPRLDLDHVRETIGFSRSTAASLLALAARLQLPRPERILSVAELSNRLISLRLDPGRHPVPGDSVTAILRDAVGAIRRRDNVSAVMKAMFLGWFAAMAVAPRSLARGLAVQMLFPGRRDGLNRLLGRLQRRRDRQDG